MLYVRKSVCREKKEDISVRKKEKRCKERERVRQKGWKREREKERFVKRNGTCVICLLVLSTPVYNLSLRRLDQSAGRVIISPNAIFFSVSWRELEARRANRVRPTNYM